MKSLPKKGPGRPAEKIYSLRTGEDFIPMTQKRKSSKKRDKKTRQNARTKSPVTSPFRPMVWAMSALLISGLAAQNISGDSYWLLASILLSFFILWLFIRSSFGDGGDGRDRKSPHRSPHSPFSGKARRINFH